MAEHLDPSASETLVDNLVAHAPIVVFSAAPPGQGGENHVNERPYEYWRDLFAERGYACSISCGRRCASARRVEPWYRYNMLVFVRQDAFAMCRPMAGDARARWTARVPDLAPIGWRMRKMLRAVPASPRAMASMHQAPRWFCALAQRGAAP